MFGLSNSEVLFYGGIGMMVVCAVLAVVCVVLFVVAGRKLKRKLEEEYGRPQR